MKNINKKIYNLDDGKILVSLTKRLGRIVNTNEGIICSPKERKINKYLKDNGGRIYLEGTRKTTNLSKMLDSNKELYYVFHDIYFDDTLNIIGENGCNLIFKNCSFKNGVTIKTDGKVFFERNKYIDYSNNEYPYSNEFLNVKANETYFIFDLVHNQERRTNSKNLEINIESNKVNIYNSSIKTGYDSTIAIKTKELNIENSKLDTKNVKIDTIKFNGKDSVLNIRENANINSFKNTFSKFTINKEKTEKSKIKNKTR